MVIVTHDTHLQHQRSCECAAILDTLDLKSFFSFMCLRPTLPTTFRNSALTDTEKRHFSSYSTTNQNGFKLHYTSKRYAYAFSRSSWIQPAQSVQEQVRHALGGGCPGTNNLRRVYKALFRIENIGVVKLTYN